MKEAALALFHFGYILVGIGHSIHACPTIGAKIGSNKVRDIKRIFHSYFPQHEDLRHAIGHAGEIQHTRAKLEGARYRGTLNLGGITIQGIAGGSIVADNTIYMTNKNKLVSLQVSAQNHDNLKSVADAIYGLFRPLAK